MNTWRDRLRIYRDRESWLQARRANHRISSTDVARILGVSPFGGPWDVRAEKRGHPTKRWTPSKLRDLERGRRREAGILTDYAELTGFGVSPCHGQVILEHAEHPWAVGSPDGFAIDAFRDDRGVEAKSDRIGRGWGTSGTVIERWDAESAAVVKPYYALQAYWLMECAGPEFKAWDLVVEIPRAFDFPELRVFTLRRDQETQDELVATVAAWRERHLIGDDDLDIDASPACASVLAERFATPIGGPRAATADETPVVLGWMQAQRDLNDAEERKALLANQLLAIVGDGTGLTIGEPRRGAPGVTLIRSNHADGGRSAHFRLRTKE